MAAMARLGAAAMTRDQLEAVVRRGLTDIVIAVVRGEADTKRLNEVTDTILAAHDAAVGAALGEIDNYRRTVIPVMHLYAGDKIAACRCWKMLDPALTRNAADVTCGACKRTRAWKDAA